MSSSPASLLVTAAVVVFVLAGCGRSPEARTPMRVVRVDSNVAVLCNCDDEDDEEEEDLDRPKARPVEYVKLTEWQPPPSVQRVEAAIVPRGTAPPSYIEFPRLELHRPIDPPGYRPVGKYFGRKR